MTLVLAASTSAAEVNRVARTRIILDLLKDGTVTTPANYQDTKVDYLGVAASVRYIDAICAQTGGPPPSASNHAKATHYLNLLKVWHRSMYVTTQVDAATATAESTTRVTSEAQVDTDIGTAQFLPHLSIDSVSVAENAGTATFTVTAEHTETEDITFDYATADGTATAGNDYTAASGSGTITAGQTTTTIDVSITDDVDEEAAESFTVTISNASNAEITTATGTGTIQASDGS
jgi:hypothetical protein